MKKLKLGFFADGPWSHQTLERLVLDQSLQIDFICARHDKPDPTLKLASEKYGIFFLTHANVNSDEFFGLINSYECDLFVSMSFNQIFKTRLINTPSLGSINCHAGMLPFYRGRNVLNWALINDEKEFGITVHYIDEGIDTGDIIMQKSYEITDDDDYSTLLKKAYSECASILFQSIKNLQSGNVMIKKQIEISEFGSYCSARIEGDEFLNWDQSSRDVFNFVRAICDPGPQARTWLNENEVRINKIELVPGATKFRGIAGSVIGVEGDTFIAKTSDSFVRVKQWSGIGMPKIGDRFRCGL